MKPDEKEPHVEPIPGEKLRYRVRSASFPQSSHVVDLSMYQGNGACLCSDFLMRREVAIKRGSPLYTRQTLCKHLLAARNYFLNQILKTLSKQLHPTK